MARSSAEKQRDSRRRELKDLVECRAWVKRRYIERLIDAGTLTDAQGDDMMARGEAVAAAAEAWIANNVTG